MPRHLAKLTHDDGEAPFLDRLEIGRGDPDSVPPAGRLELDHPTISWRHCVVSQDLDGRFFVRDLSKNGTRVDDRRLAPNIEVEIQPGQAITVGPIRLELSAEDGEVPDGGDLGEHYSTVLDVGPVFVTLLVGDLRGYTALNQDEDAERIAPAVHRVFSELEGLITEHGGSIKEYQGDAVLAFWEASVTTPGEHAHRALEAALALDHRVRELASQPDVWPFPNHPLRVDFAVVTGGVVISSYGEERPTGMSMVGDAVNVAFRIEKLVTDDTGPIIVCATSRQLADERFEFDELGEFEILGRQGMERLYALRRQGDG